MSDRGFLATATTGLSVTDATGRVALAAKGAVALVQNRGASWVYFKFGDATVVATTSDTPLGPGAGIAMDQGTFTHIAAICDSTETSTIKITTGGGQVALTQSAEVAISGVTVTTDTEATATASAPNYSEGTSNDLSMNLTGDLRVIAKIAATQTLATVTTVGAVTAITNALPVGTNVIGHVIVDSGAITPAATEAHLGQVGGTTANPTSTLTRPADTTAYALNDLIASSTTAGSVVVPSFTATRVAAGSGTIPRVRLYSNVTTGWDAATVTIRLWSAAPTYTNGDNGAYAVATGAAGYLASFPVTLNQVADGAYGVAAPAVGNALSFKLTSGTSIFWDLQLTTIAGNTPISAQTFTLIPEILQD